MSERVKNKRKSWILFYVSIFNTLFGLGSVVSKYHGFGGGVKSISCYNDSGTAMFAACGLDRYLRVYTMDPPTVVYKVGLVRPIHYLLAQ